MGEPQRHDDQAPTRKRRGKRRSLRNAQEVSAPAAEPEAPRGPSLNPPFPTPRTSGSEPSPAEPFGIAPELRVPTGPPSPSQAQIDSIWASQPRTPLGVPTAPVAPAPVGVAPLVETPRSYQDFDIMAEHAQSQATAAALQKKLAAQKEFSTRCSTSVTSSW